VQFILHRIGQVKQAPPDEDSDSQPAA
jgi:hypothetical protein